MKAIIIEDEIVAAQALQALIGEVSPDVQIVAVLQSIDESVEWFQTGLPPDLAFMDIHLADGSAFTIFEKTNVPCPTIFTTAYDEYALKAFEVNSIDYLLKPIVKKDLARSIDKYRNFSFHPDNNSALINKLLTGIKQAATPCKSYFLVPEKDKLIPLATHHIAYIYIDAKMVKAVTFAGRTYYMDTILDDLMRQLDPQLFFRANRQYIIAHKAVKDLSLWFGGKLSVNLNVAAPERILVSKARVGEFKHWFAGMKHG
ncbi:MAG: LytTR family DNA-binding domain-containing protein [Dysgonamonadaceae bacterium]|jgi:two-component system LytT family response regulator|nr:LytTR family DNA-binding domain-containing protein [Dysgonamonadaceae bacterium]